MAERGKYERKPWMKNANRELQRKYERGDLKKVKFKTSLRKGVSKVKNEYTDTKTEVRKEKAYTVVVTEVREFLSGIILADDPASAADLAVLEAKSNSAVLSREVQVTGVELEPGSGQPCNTELAERHE